MPRAVLPWLSVVAVLVVPAVLWASVPDAAQPGKSIYISLYGFPGAGLSLDAKFWRSIGFGTSFTGGRPGLYPGQPGEDPDGDNIVFEAYVNVVLARSSGRGPRPYGISLLGGVWITQGVQRPLIGVCCTYWADDRFVMRANLAYGPSSGLEVGYVLAENLEATLTLLSGRGVLGLRFGVVEPRQFAPNADDLVGDY